MLRLLACVSTLRMVMGEGGRKHPTDVTTLLQRTATIAEGTLKVPAAEAAWAEFTPESPLNPWIYRAGTKMPMRGGGDFPSLFKNHSTCKQQQALDEDIGIVPEYVKWRFAPPNSTGWLQQLAGPVLCQRLIRDAHIPGQPRILFVGDSRSREQMLALMSSLPPYTTWDNKSARVSPDDLLPRAHSQPFSPSKNYGAFACGGRLWIQQQGSLHLDRDYNGTFIFKEHVPWLQSFDVVVLQLQFGELWQGVRPSLDFWKEVLLPHQRLLLRTASVGHEHTGSLYNSTWDVNDVWPVFRRRRRAPFQSPEEVVKYYGSIEGHRSWLQLREEQESMIADLERGGFTVADYYWISAMMWDRHKDPLHYCIPGPADQLNVILFNWIMRGHIRDFQEWSKEFSRAVLRLGGLRNVNGTSF